MTDAGIMTNKAALRAIVVLRVLARFAGANEPLPVMFSDGEHTDNNIFMDEWVALGIDRTYPHGIRNRYQFFYASHLLEDLGLLTNLPRIGRWARGGSYYTPTQAGYDAVERLGDDWTTWQPLEPAADAEPEHA